MKSKYIDTVATMNVLGNIYTNPMLLDAGDKYFFNSHLKFQKVDSLFFKQNYDHHDSCQTG